jgi:hypothetical protein
MFTTKNIVVTSVAVSLLAMGGLVFAKPNFSSVQLSTPGTSRSLVLPTPADNSPVISLGSALDPGTGKVVEGYAIIHYRSENAKPSQKGGGVSACYTFLASGAKWKTLEPWMVNPANSRGLASDFVLNNLAGNIGKWEDAADGILNNGVFANILGDGSSTADPLVADTTAPDNKNEVYFADVSTQGAIAVTIVWGIFGGPPAGRELVEWDQIYDDIDYDWSNSGESTKMDFENIATHELGHSVGLGDLYNSSCSEETMYGYAGFGEIKKRDLNAGDIAGVNKLY